MRRSLDVFPFFLCNCLRVAVPFCIPINRVWEFCLRLILIKTYIVSWNVLAILVIMQSCLMIFRLYFTGDQWYQTCFHGFIGYLYLFLVNFKNLCLFKNWCFLIIIINFKLFFLKYSQDLSYLSYIYIVPVFSQSVACLFVFLTVLEEEKLLSFMKFSILVFSFMIYAFGPLRNFCLLQSCEDFVSCFILEVLQCFYIEVCNSFWGIFVFSIRAKFFSFYLIASFNWKYFFCFSN